MPLQIVVTRDWDHMSLVAATLVEADIQAKLATEPEYVLGLATGNTPTGLYKHLAKACNAGRIDASKIRSFNLDEYLGLPSVADPCRPPTPTNSVLLNDRSSAANPFLGSQLAIAQSENCQSDLQSAPVSGRSRTTH